MALTPLKFEQNPVVPSDVTLVSKVSTSAGANNTYFDVTTIDLAGQAPGTYKADFNLISNCNGATFTGVVAIVCGLTTDVGNSFSDVENPYLYSTSQLVITSASPFFTNTLSNIDITWDGTDITIADSVQTGSILRLKAYLYNYSGTTPTMKAYLRVKRVG